MSGLTAGHFPALFSHRATVKQKPAWVLLPFRLTTVSGVRVGNYWGNGSGKLDKKRLVVVAGKRPFVDRSASTTDLKTCDPAIDIASIESPCVRLIDEERKMVGIVSTDESIQMAKDAGLDLVVLSRDSDPPVVRILNYSKYKYEQDKKKREIQKKSAAKSPEIKELKMGCNIGIHDYNVRLRAAKKFLQEGDKVKFIVRFKRHDYNFTEKATDVLKRFVNDLKEMAVVETKSIQEKIIFLVLKPNKGMVKGQLRTNNTKSGENPPTDQEPMTEDNNPMANQEPMTQVSVGV